MMLIVAVCGIAARLVARVVSESTNPRDLVYCAAFGHDTAYAPSYWEPAFRRLRIGMSEKETRKVAGAPLREQRDSVGNAYWRYTESPGDTHYWKRELQFTSGRISAIVNEFYVD
jgi:hypothetical protein